MLAAATRIFARRGYQDASMDEIAAACGITKPMLYSYFDSKEGLFLACLDKGDERLRAAVRDAVEGATGAAAALVNWAGDRPDEPSELHALRLMNFAWMGLGNLVRGELWLPPTEEEQK